MQEQLQQRIKLLISGTTLTQAEATIGRLIKHFLDCIQFNTHTVESIFENRVVAWDAETRLWKNLNRLNSHSIISQNFH